MPHPKINFLNHLKKEEPAKKNNWKKILFFPVIFFGIFILVFSVQIIFSSEGLLDSIEKMNIFSNYGFNISEDKLLQGEAEDRINVLLLGMGGKGHPGPYLTDTIILVSIRPSDGKVALVSIPRDLSAPIPGYGWRKINNANHYGEMEKPGQGGEFARQTVAKILDMPIHYYVRVDFTGFEKLIDELGGIKVNVENSFVDNTFPTDNYGYQTLTFEAGLQKMDGKTALNYARSRHGSNGESSDFARSKRQQTVLQSIKEKSLSFSTFLSLRKLSALFEMYKENVTTNLAPWEIFKFAKMAKKIDTANPTTVVLDNSTNGPLYATNMNGAYILLPRDMSFNQIQLMIENAFDPQKQIAVETPANLEIQNGTKVTGLAYRTSQDLKTKGFKVIKIGNATEQNYQNTYIYDLTKGQKSEKLNKLQSELKAKISQDIPTQINNDSSIDFLIILGQDQINEMPLSLLEQ